MSWSRRSRLRCRTSGPRRGQVGDQELVARGTKPDQGLARVQGHGHRVAGLNGGARETHRYGRRHRVDIEAVGGVPGPVVGLAELVSETTHRELLATQVDRAVCCKGRCPHGPIIRGRLAEVAERAAGRDSDVRVVEPVNRLVERERDGGRVEVVVECGPVDVDSHGRGGIVQRVGLGRDTDRETRQRVPVGVCNDGSSSDTNRAVETSDICTRYRHKDRGRLLSEHHLEICRSANEGDRYLCVV